MKKISAVMMALVLTIGLCLVGCSSTPERLGAGYYPGTLTSLLPNYPYPPMVFTATSQTLTQALSGQSYCTFSVTANTLTTATFTIEGSSDGGTTYYPWAVAPLAGSATLASVLTAITVTTAPKMYVANVAGLTNFEIVTSSTFTATSVTVTPVCTSNKGLL